MADQIKVPLKFPITTGAGERLESLPITRLKRKDLSAAQNFSKNEGAQEDFLLAKMTSITLEDLNDLDIADSATLSKVFRGMVEGKDLAAIVGRSSAPGAEDAAVGNSEPGDAGLPDLG